jgi:hypothetical protein
MNNNKTIQVDISKLDSEIEQLQSQIDELQAKVKLRQQFKDYLVSNYVGGSEESSEVVVNPSKSLNTIPTTISEFITAFVAKNEGATGRQVAEGYADAIQAEYHDIRNNVFNALSRLKSAHKLRAELDDNSISKYYINNESSQEAA